MKKCSFAAAGVLVVFMLSMTVAYGEGDGVPVEVTGRNVNLVKTLCGDDAPAADTNALKIKEVLGADGNAIEGYAGKLLHYLPADAAADLMKGDAHADKVVTVKGVLYANAQAIAVTDFEVEVAAESDGDGWDDWDDWDELGVTTMSQQQVI